MHSTRNPRQPKKLDLRRETLRRLADLNDQDLRQVIGGQRSGTRSPSIIPTSETTPGC